MEAEMPFLSSSVESPQQTDLEISIFVPFSFAALCFDLHRTCVLFLVKNKSVIKIPFEEMFPFPDVSVHVE